ncbi:MAG: metallophosphoesterase family protein [Myxococcales bacterium]|nr:metallophosphoesterase family protein [Myxococcales bacterium]
MNSFNEQLAPLVVRLTLVAGVVLGLAACVRGAPSSDPGNQQLTGGTIALQGCGYSMTTREGASPPVLGEGAFGSDPTPRLVHLGLASDPTTSVTISWRTADETTKATYVRFGTDADLASEQQGVTFVYKPGISATDPEVRIHEAHLCGLQPGTEYQYKVGGETDGAAHWSPVYSFRTAPEVTDDTVVSLAIVGDSRSGYDVWSALVGELDARSPDLILFSGDAVMFGHVQTEWETFFEQGASLLTKVPMVAAHGNHEANSVTYYSQVALPGDEENYSLDYGHAHVTVLNDTPLNTSDLSGKIADFLSADLAANASAPWKFVMHHRPTYSSSTSHGSDETLRALWAPIFDANDVDLVLNGHDHNYERSKPMKGNAAQASPADGTVYLVTGGAGASLYENGDTPAFTEYSEKTYNAAVIEVRKNSWTVTSFKPDGTPIESPFGETTE